jgi:hypothetical protein
VREHDDDVDVSAQRLDAALRVVSATGSVNSRAATFDGMMVYFAARLPITPMTPSRTPLRSRRV